MSQSQEHPIVFRPKQKQQTTPIKLSALPPLSLYVHIPWCIQKCPYCDFNSHEKTKLSFEEASAYVNTLLSDLEQALPLIWGRPIRSIFMGGGTPSLFSPHHLNQLLEGIRARTTVLPDTEITLEANPATVESQKFSEFRQIGINRLSIGVQSFDPTALSVIGRVHSAQEACLAIETAQRYFENFNIDLMFALPNQTESLLKKELAKALSFSPPHLSYYHLTMEPNTVFAKYPPSGLPDEDTGAHFYNLIETGLAEAGFDHYETSAWAKPQHTCDHNMNYWQFGDYLGIGAGAHSKISFPHEIIRQVRTHSPQRYQSDVSQGTHIKQSTPIASQDLLLEFLMNTLRLEQGVPTHWFSERTGLTTETLNEFQTKAIQKGWLEIDATQIKPTEQGRYFLNDLLLLAHP
jgi:putative oxygen-independent coproporphyrinogen III oxidase